MEGYITLGVAVIVLAIILRQFRPAATQEITENLYSVRCGFVNFYAYRTPNGVILFDTGMNPALAKRGLSKISIEPDMVTHIFLTHTDYDHAGGVVAFPNVQPYISKQEEQMINGETSRRGFVHNNHISAYHTLEDGDTINVGNTSVQIRVTPGHTPGSASYLIDGRYLVSGDLLRLAKDGSVKPFLWLMNKDHKQDIKSVNDMAPTIKNSEFIMTGHTGYTRHI